MGNKPVKIATQYERLMARVAARSGWTPRKRRNSESGGGEVERAGVEKATVVKEATETEGVKEQPVFDAASWKPTEQAGAEGEGTRVTACRSPDDHSGTERGEIWEKQVPF